MKVLGSPLFDLISLRQTLASFFLAIGQWPGWLSGGLQVAVVLSAQLLLHAPVPKTTCNHALN